MTLIPREIVVCRKPNGREPFTDWLDALDPKSLAIVLVRIDRIEDGNLGDCKSVGDGVWELRIEFGPGYRVYFGQRGHEVHLLGGGSKRRQQHDIDAAKKFWRGHDEDDDSALS